MLASAAPSTRRIVLVAVGGWFTVTVRVTVPVVLLPAASVAWTANESLPVKFGLGVYVKAPAGVKPLTFPDVGFPVCENVTCPPPGSVAVSVPVKATFSFVVKLNIPRTGLGDPPPPPPPPHAANPTATIAGRLVRKKARTSCSNTSCSVLDMNGHTATG